MERTIALIVGLLVSVADFAHAADVYAPPTPGRADSLGFDLTLAGESYKTPALNSLLIGPTLDLGYRHLFSPYAEARVAGGVELLTGATSGTMPSDLIGQRGPRQNLRLREALVDLHSEEKTVSARVGALNQIAWDNPLFGGDIAFLGGEVGVRAQSPIGQVDLTLEEAVPPTSFSLLESSQGGRTPGFTGARLSDQIGNEASDFFRVTAGYFQFDNLTTAQARQSLFWGNTVVGPTNSSQFYVPYRGVEGGVRGGFEVAERWQGVARANIIQNTAAPAGSGFGYLTEVGAKYRLGEAKIGAAVGYLYDQSDSSPAVFSDAFLNSKNHSGFETTLSYDTATYAVFARALRTRALVEQPYGGDNTAFLLGVRLHYDLL